MKLLQVISGNCLLIVLRYLTVDPSYSLVYLLANEESPRHFLMRCKTTFSNEIKDFMASDKTDLVTTIYLSLESIEVLKKHGYIVTKNTGTAIRLLKVLIPGGEKELLLTNLFDQKEYTAKKIFNFYTMR